ncbi:hypothetical protein Tco_0487183 [Tanacetum coccineum]
MKRRPNGSYGLVCFREGLLCGYGYVVVRPCAVVETGTEIFGKRGSLVWLFIGLVEGGWLKGRSTESVGYVGGGVLYRPAGLPSILGNWAWKGSSGLATCGPPPPEGPPVVIEPLRIEYPFQEDPTVEPQSATRRTIGSIAPSTHRGVRLDAILIPEMVANQFRAKAWVNQSCQIKQLLLVMTKEGPLAHIVTSNKITSTMGSQCPSKLLRIKLLLFPFSIEGMSTPWILRIASTDTFLYCLDINDQDSFDSQQGGNFLDKMPLRMFKKNHRSKSKVRKTRAKAVVAKVSTNSSTQAVSSDVAELKDIVRALLLDKKNQASAPAPAPAPVKAVELSCVTCGGAHSHQNCPATHGNVYRDNISDMRQSRLPSQLQPITAPVQPPVGPEPITTPVLEPIVAPVVAPVPNTKPTVSLPYPSRRDNEKSPLLPDLTPTLLDTRTCGIDQFLNPMGIGKRHLTVKVGVVFHFQPTLCQGTNPTYLPESELSLKSVKLVQQFFRDEPTDVELKGAGLPISIPWGFSPIHVVPKKGGMTVVVNEENELIPTRLVTGMAGMLDYRTFQRCLLAILFMTWLERDGSLYGRSSRSLGILSKTCALSRLDHMLQRCEDTNLSLNWEKSHFMVKEGIVLGHKISKKGIEVDKAKIDVIAKLPHLSTNRQRN